jgi:hypothetical protein
MSSHVMMFRGESRPIVEDKDDDYDDDYDSETEEFHPTRQEKKHYFTGSGYRLGDDNQTETTTFLPGTFKSPTINDGTTSRHVEKVSRMGYNNVPLIDSHTRLVAEKVDFLSKWIYHR